MGEDGDDAGVEAAGQEAGHRDVGDQVRPDRLLDHGLQVRWGLPGTRRRRVAHMPVLPDLKLAARPDPGPGSGRQLAHALDGAALLGDPVIEHRGDERARLDPQFRAEGRDDRLELGGEDDAVTALDVEEGLDAQRVAGEHQFAGRRVGDGEREHAAELVEGGRPPVPPAFKHDLGVRGGDEGRARCLQLCAQLLVVVEFAVVDQRQAALAHRLVGRGGEVDDRQPPVPEVQRDPFVLVAPDPARVRTAVRDPVGHHVGQLAPVGLLVAAGYPAHGSDLPVGCPGSGACLPAARRRARRRPGRRARKGPGELFLDPGPADLAHPLLVVGVVDQVHDRLGVVAHVLFGDPVGVT